MRRTRNATACLLAVIVVDVALGHGFAWEANTEPEHSGWSIGQIACNPTLWLGEGWFFQHVELCPGYDPPYGQSASYRRSLAEFDGAPDFFVEWRVHCDAPRGDLYPWGGGAVLAVGGIGGVIYNCYIVRDQVWLLRDNRLPYVFVDINPDKAHTYRLKLYGVSRYTWYIDGQIVDEGVPEGQFPSATPIVIWRARAAWGPNTTRWDYIRYGRLTQLTADANCDGRVDNLDIDPFILAISDAAGFAAAHPACDRTNADCNHDGNVNNFDIDAFVECLASGCP